MAEEMKNVKISKKHHDMIKNHCDEKGLKIYKLIQKWIDENCKPKRKDIYGE
jgi:hypothetical protein